MSYTTQKIIENLKAMNIMNNNFTEKEIDTFIFCFLLIGYLEKNIQTTIYYALLQSQKNKAKYPALIDLLLKEDTFGQKIDIFKFVIKQTKSWEHMKDFIKFCERINYGIRNSLFHFKLNELKYNDLDVSKVETQNKIMFDLVRAEVKAKKHIEEHIINKKPDTTPKQKP